MKLYPIPLNGRMPIGFNRHNKKRNKNIFKMRMKGKTFQEIGNKYNLTHTRVREIYLKERRVYDRILRQIHIRILGCTESLFKTNKIMIIERIN